MGVAVFGGANSLLLLLYAATSLHPYPNRPLQVLITHLHRRIGIQQLEETADGLVDGVGIATTEGPTELDATLEDACPALNAKLVPALGEEVRDEPEVVGEVLAGVELGRVPAGHEGM